MQKALILGTGGTGARSIIKICDLIKWRQNTLIEDFRGDIEYYEIDTDPNSLEDSDYNFHHLEVSESKVQKFLREMDGGRHEWADKNMIRRLSIPGDSLGLRSVGKFAFLYHYDRIKENIENRLRNLYATPGDPTQKKRIYIIANSVSGTGSGCFVDYGYLVRKIINDNPVYRDDPYLNITLILTLPAGTGNSWHLRNSYHALEELNHFMSGSDYSIEHPIRKDEFIKMSEDYIPFHYVYLIGPRSGENMEAGDLENIIGEYIYYDIFSPSADTLDGARDDMNKYQIRKDKLGYCQRYMTFGFSTISYPIEQISKAATYKYIGDSIKKWRENTQIPSDYNFDKIYLEIDGGYKTPGTIYYELLKETDISVHGGDVHTMNIDVMINQIIKNAFDKFEENDFDISYINALLDSINADFIDSNQVSGEYSNGTIRAVIQDNIRKLKTEGTGWSFRIKDELTGVALNELDGLRLAGELITQINGRLDAIANKNINETSYIDIRNQIEVICTEIESLRTDKLLKVVNLHKFAIKQRVDKCRKKIEDYVSDRLNIVSVKAARELVSKSADNNPFNFRACLDNFAGWLVIFNNDLDSWAADLSKKYSDIITPKMHNGHIVWHDKIEQLANALIISSESKNVSGFLNGEFGKICAKKLNENNIKSEPPFLKRKDKEDIIMEERKYFVSRLEDKRVIEEFMEEEANRAEMKDDLNGDIISQVNEKAGFFIDISERDNYTIGERETLEKKWFFYPGGHLCRADNVNENIFAKELNDRFLVRNWSGQSKDSSDPRTILILQEKGGFPLRYLNMLHEEMMVTALEDIQEINEFISRVDIKFLPFMENNKKE